jgi:hypothetical protein
MWPLLRKSKIVPHYFTCENDQDCPSQLHIGFTDVMYGICETQSNRITDNMLQEGKFGLYERLIQHCHRVSIDMNIPIEDACPMIIAFAGIRQYKALFIGDKEFDAQPKKKSKVTSILPTVDNKISSQLSKFFQQVSTTSKAAVVATTQATLGADAKIAAIDLTEEDNEKEANSTSISKILSNNTSLTAAEEEVILLVDDDSNDIPSTTTPTIFSESSKTTESRYGIQSSRPFDWPQELQKSILYLLPSTSGAAAMTNEERETPYLELGKLLQSMSLPNQLSLCTIENK